MNLRVAVIVDRLKLPTKNKRLWHLLIEEIMGKIEFDLTRLIKIGQLAILFG
jgi:hypothetical protein